MIGGNGKAQVLYEQILKVANQFLRNAKMFEISILQGHNPSYEELAEILRRVAALIYDLTSDKDPHLAQKALDYVHIMASMAVAIRNDQPEELSKLVEELDNKPFL